MSLSLRYEDGLLLTAATRGDGTSGDDVTSNAKTIRNIPLRLKRDAETPARAGKEGSLFAGAAAEVMEVRGEVYISREQFAKINAAQEEAGEEPYANPRNTAAGTLKQVDLKIVASRKLAFLPHGAGEVVGGAAAKIENYHQWQSVLQRVGFQTSAHFKRCADIETVLEYIRAFAESRKNLPYDTDGVVVKVDDFAQRERLGVTAKAPRWCIAFKYQPEQAETVLVRVVFQVGKTGTITPVAEFDPAPFISGTNVYRASLHNFDEIERKDIHLHDRVMVEKAGEVIPYVVGVVAAKRPAHAKKIARPKECSSCHTPPTWNTMADSGALRRIRPVRAQLAELSRCGWTGRNQMDIAEIGEKLIEKLMEKGYVKSIPDLYRLTHEQMFDTLRKEGVKDSNPAKAAQNAIDGIAASKDRGLERVLAGLGILDIGVRTAQNLAGHFVTMERLQKATLEEILQAPDMGGGLVDEFRKFQERHAPLAGVTLDQLFGLEKMPAAAKKWLDETAPKAALDMKKKGVAAQSLYQFLHSDAGKKTIHDLQALGIKLEVLQVKKTGPQPLAGMTIVVTGTLHQFTRDSIKAKIESLGGKATDSVSKTTTFLLAGESAGSKLEKARKLNVEILDEAAFLKRIGE